MVVHNLRVAVVLVVREELNQLSKMTLKMLLTAQLFLLRRREVEEAKTQRRHADRHIAETRNLHVRLGGAAAKCCPK